MEIYCQIYAFFGPEFFQPFQLSNKFLSTHKYYYFFLLTTGYICRKKSEGVDVADDTIDQEQKKKKKKAKKIKKADSVESGQESEVSLYTFLICNDF